MTGLDALHNRPEPLIQRIDLQSKYGTRDLTSWFLHLASPCATDRVLDIGCGSGNHLLEFAKLCASGTGIDISADLLLAAQSVAASLDLENVRFVQSSGDGFDLPGETFEIAMCNFAIYYMDAAEVIRRLAKHLTPDGVGYIMGSPDENARELLEIHAQGSDFVPNTYAPGYSDIRKYLPAMQEFFGECAFHRFFNPVVFPSSAEFMAYYRSTGLFQDAMAVEPFLEEKITEASERVFQAKGSITITKVVDTAELRRPAGIA